MMTFVRNIAGPLLIVLSLSISVAFAQHEHSEDPVQPNEKLFGEVLETGSFVFHLRSYFMATLNQGELTDYSYFISQNQ